MFSRVPVLICRFCGGCLNFKSHSTLAALVDSRTQVATRASSSRLNKSKKLLQKKHGIYLIPELTSPTGFNTLYQRISTLFDALLYEATSPNRSRPVLQILDEIAESLLQISTISASVKHLHPDVHYQDLAEDVFHNASALIQSFAVNADIQKIANDLLEQGNDLASIDISTAHLLQDLILSCDPDKREFILTANQTAGKLESEFFDNAQQPIQVPSQLQSVISPDILLQDAFLENQDETIRSAGYKVLFKEESKQEETLCSLMECRYNAARMMGFRCFSDQVNHHSFLSSQEHIMHFLSETTQQLKWHVQKEVEEASKLKKVACSTLNSFSVWDLQYLNSVARLQNCSQSATETRAYFSLGNCIEGLNHLICRLFGVTLKLVPTVNGEVWSEDVLKFQLVADNEACPLGVIYCDFFPKTGQVMQDEAFYFTIRSSRHRLIFTEDAQPPILCVSLNFPAPSRNHPSLLFPHMVENLFHELGRAVTAIICDKALYSHLHFTGAQFSTDFSEVPNTLFEYYAFDPRLLELYAKHWSTGESLPESLSMSLSSSRSIFPALQHQQQIFYSALDQTLHGVLPLAGSTTEVMQQLSKEFFFLPVPAGTAWQHRFSHLVSYGAKYYSYLVSRSISALIWRSFLATEPINRESGDKICRLLLSQDQTVNPCDIVRDFTSSDVSVDTLVKALVSDLDDTSVRI